MLVGAASVLDSIGVPLVNFDFEKMKQKAEKEAAGLQYWNDPEFLADQATLVNFVKNNPNATAVMQITFRNDIIRRMKNFLKLQGAKTAHPNLTSQRLDNPIIIVGLPRTGTTFLQRMMSQDLENHGPAMWELFDPVRIDESEIAIRERDRTDRFIKTVRNTSMNLWSIHPTYTDEADECYFAMPQSLGDNFIYCGMDHFEWYMKRSALPDYRLYRQYLQAMHYNRKDRRYILKTPLHMPKLDDLLTVFPDAYIVWCHRPLREVIASWISFTVISRKYTHKKVDGHAVAREQLEVWSRSIKEAQKARDKHSPDHFFDVKYEDFVSNPLGMIRSIYDHFGIGMTDEAAAKMTEWYEKDRKEQRLGHNYSLEQFGLTTKDLKVAFNDYLLRYDVSVE